MCTGHFTAQHVRFSPSVLLLLRMCVLNFFRSYANGIAGMFMLLMSQLCIVIHYIETARKITVQTYGHRLKKSTRKYFSILFVFYISSTFLIVVAHISLFIALYIAFCLSVYHVLCHLVLWPQD